MSEKPSEDSSSNSEVPDDVWEQFARANEQAAPKEPSARARMVTERLRQQEARGELPEGWRTGPPLQEKRRGRRIWPVLGLLLAVLVAVVALKPSLLPGLGGDSTDSASGERLPDETAAPTAPPSAAAPATPTLDDPFAGSPAKRWADGAAGIVLPEAKAVGGKSKAEVAQALRLTRELLIDSNLNPATLRGERPETALGILEPKQKGVLAELKAGLSKPSEKNDPLAMFTRFDPNGIRTVGDVVKTRGRITFKAGEGTAVAVHADYTFVYPVVRTDGSTEVTRTIVRRVLELEVSDPARYAVTPGKLTVLRYDRDAGNSTCGVHDGWFHPEFPSDAPTDGPSSGPTTDPYDRSKDIRDSKDCGTASRV
ncbi:hypothetical protein [Streptomyces sp. S.PB5]|uniref:hypothetical protein n=1 Tax=Streptomyces sp. S.PB5 TaxID=3020844 RepID=UPI0025B03D99|nr:hypothetical protein [Streptomyces sp. S.PB5]MDN3024560.1 hypothetical protein [Streptomyces sp. S.PB5]